MMPHMNTATDQSPVLGHEIKRLREEAGRSQQQLATYAGIGMTTLIRAEKSEPGVTYRNIVKIARALDVDPAAIYRDAMTYDMPGGTGGAPLWAVQHHEQVTTALADLRVMVERLEISQRELAHEMRGNA